LCLAIRVVFLLALVILSARCPALHAQGLSESGLQETRAALAAAQSGDWNRAYASAAATGDMLPLKIIRWMDYSRPGAPGRFADIAEFVDTTPTGRGRRRCASTPRKLWPANPTRLPLIGSSATLR